MMSFIFNGAAAQRETADPAAMELSAEGQGAGLLHAECNGCPNLGRMLHKMFA